MQNIDAAFKDKFAYEAYKFIRQNIRIANFPEYNSIEEYIAAKNLGVLPGYLKMRFDETTYLVEENRINRVVVYALHNTFMVGFFVDSMQIDVYWRAYMDSNAVYGCISFDPTTKQPIEGYKYFSNDAYNQYPREEKCDYASGQLMSTTYFTDYNGLSEDIKVKLEGFQHKDKIMGFKYKDIGTILYLKLDY